MLGCCCWLHHLRVADVSLSLHEEPRKAQLAQWAWRQNRLCAGGQMPLAQRRDQQMLEAGEQSPMREHPIHLSDCS